MRTVSIIGVGMMGGSLGLALRRARFARVIGLGRDPKKLSAAKRRGACDEVSTDWAQGVSRSELVVVCTTVPNILPSLRKILPHLKSGAVASDIGSVKSDIAAQAGKLFAGSRAYFIGGHPLAGSEKTGSEHADASLYRGATVALCPPAGSPARAAAALRALWKAAGADCVAMGADVHDLLVAQTSHLPHVLSAALVQLIAGLSRRDRNAPRLLAGSFRDMTRISDSDPEQWTEICGANQKFVLGALKSFRDILSRRIREAERGEGGWFPFFAAARKDRAALLSKKNRAS